MNTLIPCLRSAAAVAVGTLLAVTTSAVWAGLSIEHIGYHHYTPSSLYSEGARRDFGGVVYVAIRNTGATPETITNATLNGTLLGSIPQVRYWRVEENPIPAGGVGTMIIKGTNTPIAENLGISLQVRALSGAVATHSATLATPKLRLGSVMPSQDRKTISLLLKNTDTAALTIEQVLMGDDVTARCTFVGGATIGSNSVGIVRVAFDQPQPLLMSRAVRVVASRAGGGTVTVAAPVRLIPPWLPGGTYGSDTYIQATTHQFNRRWNMDTLMGRPTAAEGRSLVQRYNTDVMLWVGDPGNYYTNDASAWGRQDWVRAWSLADEPEGQAGKSSTAMSAYHQELRRHGPDKPTFVTLHKNRDFGEYGHVSDIVGVDHYVMHAPSVLSTRQLQQSLDYAEVLKQNVEPRLMWNWAQGISTVWSTQPADWGIALQYWMQFMGGAKGWLWFNCLPENATGRAAQFETMRREAQRLNLVRGLLLYGEVMNNVTVSTNKLLARASYGEAGLVVMVINGNTSGSGTVLSPFSIGAVSGTVTVPIPAWLPVQQVYEVRPEGTNAASYSLGGGSLTLNVNLEANATNAVRVYVIGRNDHQPPAAPSRVNVVAAPGNNTLMLTWREPHDNFGVLGYRVLTNGVLAGQVSSPFFTNAPVASNALDTIEYRVEALDAAGNVSPASGPARHASWKFDADGWMEGWDPRNHLTNVAASGGRLDLELAGGDPYLSASGLEFNGSLLPRLRVRLQNQTRATRAQQFSFWPGTRDLSRFMARHPERLRAVSCASRCRKLKRTEVRAP